MDLISGKHVRTRVDFRSELLLYDNTSMYSIWYKRRVRLAISFRDLSQEGSSSYVEISEYLMNSLHITLIFYVEVAIQKVANFFWIFIRNRVWVQHVFKEDILYGL